MTEPDDTMPDEELVWLLGIDDETLALWYATGHLDLWVQSEELSALLKIDRGTPSRWMEKGTLPGIYTGSRRTLHRTSVVNTFLASCPHNFPVPPTLADLRNGQIVLLTAAEGRDTLGYKTAVSIRELIRKDELTGIRLQNNWRVSRASVEAMQRARAELSQTHITREYVIYITGYSEDMIGHLVRTRVLRSTESGHSRNEPVEIASLLAFLPSVLPDWMDAKKWFTDRLRELERPVVQTVAAVHMGVNPDYMRSVMDQHHIEFIRSPQGSGSGTRTFIPPSAIRRYVDKLPTITMEQIAISFDLPVEEIYAMRNTGRLECPLPLHVHRGNDLKSPCATAIWDQLGER